MQLGINNKQLRKFEVKKDQSQIEIKKDSVKVFEKKEKLLYTI